MKQTVCLTASDTVIQSCFIPNIILTLRGTWCFQLLSQSVVGIELFPTVAWYTAFFSLPSQLLLVFVFVSFQNFVAIAFFSPLPFLSLQSCVRFEEVEVNIYVHLICLTISYSLFFDFLKTQYKIMTCVFFSYSPRKDVGYIFLLFLLFVANSTILNSVAVSCFLTHLAPYILLLGSQIIIVIGPLRQQYVGLISVFR